MLNATINLFAYATVKPSSNGTVLLHAVDLERRVSYPAAGRLPIDGPLPLHAAVYNRIVRDFTSGDAIPLTLATHSDAPPGSGLGSSSTLVVAMVKGLVEYLRLPLGDYDIARLAFSIEREDMGMAGGRQDQYAATFGGFNFMEFYDRDRSIINPLRIKNWISYEIESSLLLYYTGTSRASADLISRQTENVNQRKANVIDALHQLKLNAVELKAALLRGDIGRFGTIFCDGWAQKKELAIGITNSTIEAAYAAAIAAGALGGKLSGAGGGGFIVFFSDPDVRPRVADSLRKIGGEIYPCHFVIQGAESWRLPQRPPRLNEGTVPA